jgi:hypothetical protein
LERLHHLWKIFEFIASFSSQILDFFSAKIVIADCPHRMGGILTLVLSQHFQDFSARSELFWEIHPLPSLSSLLGVL